MADAIAVNLPGVLDTSAAGAVKDMLLAARGSDVRISGKEVERAGTLCLQVLLAARALWNADGKSFLLVEAGMPLLAAARLSAIAETLNIGQPAQ